jgi:phospholipase A-2-activating protein
MNFQGNDTFFIVENPYAAAQEFIYRHELPQDYLDQIANFIVQNVGSTNIATQATTYGDPFTGGNRYVPGGATAPNVVGTVQ